MRCMNTDKDSYGWLELCFMGDEEERLLDELTRLDSEVDWDTVFNHFTSADFPDDMVVIFTIDNEIPVRSDYIRIQLRQALHNLHGEWVAVSVLRDAS